MKKVILVSGAMRSGKNQFAEYLKAELESHNKTVSEDLFAKTLKDWCKEDFAYFAKVINQVLFTIKEHDWNKGKITEICDEMMISDEKWYEEKNDLTRAILQIVGTNIFRDRVDQQWWIKKLIERIKGNDSEFTIVTDVRFDNEVELIAEDEEFVTVALNVFRKSDDTSLKTQHSSEAGIANHLIDYQIDNNGTLEDLKEYAKDIAVELCKQ